MYFGGSGPVTQEPQARLVLIKGEGVDGTSFHLTEAEQTVGRLEGELVLGEDPFLSPRHASFTVRNGKVIVTDVGSANGVFLRLREPATIGSGSVFLTGEQLLQIEACAPDLGPQTDAERTCFYASPKRAAKMQLIQRLRGGDIGMVYRARNESLTLGREGNDLNFPDDPFISGHHAKLECADGANFLLTDLGSKNGTFLRLNGPTALAPGDHVFMGKQLLRVEVG
jgi:pSer/pThr/pTyr-binding forkhead associated (FHA) protein